MLGGRLKGERDLVRVNHRVSDNDGPSGPVLIPPSDRGCQYVQQDYVRTLARARVELSMSRSGNCYYNATMELFGSTLKTEIVIDDDLPPSRSRAELTVFDYIETFYNPVRQHTSFSVVALRNRRTVYAGFGQSKFFLGGTDVISRCWFLNLGDGRLNPYGSKQLENWPR